jgi:hypothetical protein
MPRTQTRRGTAPAKGRTQSAGTAASTPRRRRTEAGLKAAAEPAPAPTALTEEETIESAKYLPRELPPRVFEEERFLFPESYGTSRIRLLVKDPYWIFAHWDLSPESLTALRTELGERAMALSRLTLRVGDARSGGSRTILLPEGARSWYIQTDGESRSFRGELGLTLPSGKFRKLADSNTVTTPRVGPSATKATRRARVGGASVPATRTDPEGALPESPAAPWDATPGQSWTDEAARTDRGHGPRAKRPPEQGGASDAFRR